MLRRQSGPLAKSERASTGPPLVIAYRLYMLDHENRVSGPPQIIECEDDDAALIEAGRYVDGQAIEIWRNDKRVGLIPADH